MGFRTFAQMKIQSSSVAQPLVGSWITAGLTVPRNVPVTITLGTQVNTPNVDNTGLFLPGDYALLVNADGTNVEPVYISALLSADRVTIGVQNQTGAATQLTHVSGAFGTGTFILPKVLFNNLYIQPEDGNTGALNVGNAWNMTAKFRRIVKLFFVGAGAQPVDFSSTMSFFGNPFDLSELWCLGTANDLYSVAVPVV